ncbi:MAG: transcriptional coactivator p15/PC4 family protein [Pseudomonadota bacterium]
MNAPDYISGPVWSHPKRGIVVMAGVREYRGKTFFELREWVENNDGWRPTGKGVTFPPDALDGLHAALGEWLAQQASASKLHAVK